MCVLIVCVFTRILLSTFFVMPSCFNYGEELSCFLSCALCTCVCTGEVWCSLLATYASATVTYLLIVVYSVKSYIVYTLAHTASIVLCYSLSVCSPALSSALVTTVFNL